MKNRIAPHIALLGCGHMGSAILRAWLLNLPQTYQYTIITRSRDKVASFLDNSNVHWLRAGDPLTETPTAILIAVKPQQMEEALAPYGKKDCLYITIAAGKSVAFYQPFLKFQGRLIRLMPNIAATVGESMTTAYASHALQPNDLELTTKIGTTFGKLIWLDDESLFHGVTAISSSGPAYFFLLAETLIEAAQHHGLSQSFAETLVTQTLIGSGSYLKASFPTSAEALRQQVTSPGGTTEAALSVLMNSDGLNLKTLIEKAISKAVSRSKELGQ